MHEEEGTIGPRNLFVADMEAEYPLHLRRRCRRPERMLIGDPPQRQQGPIERIR